MTTPTYNEQMARINFSLRDIMETLEIWKHEGLQHQYVRKLYREFDELMAKKQKLQKRRPN